MKLTEHYQKPKEGYSQRVKRQELLWINGICKHNDVDDECCPDFSCCEPSMFETDLAIRIDIVEKRRERYNETP